MKNRYMLRLVGVTLAALLMLCSFAGCRQIFLTEKLSEDQETNPDGSETEDDDTLPNEDKSIDIVGNAVWVDAEHAALDVAVYGNYYTIPLTAISTGKDEVDFSEALWSSSNNNVATVRGNGSSAEVYGKSKGAVDITVEADGLTAEYQVQVCESMIIQFDLSSAPANINGTYTLELPLVHDPEGDPLHKDWEYIIDWGDGSGEEILKSYHNVYNIAENIYPTHKYETADTYTIKIFTTDEAYGFDPWDYMVASEDRTLASGGWDTRPTSAPYLKDVLRFGTDVIGSGMFAFCNGLVAFSAQDTPRLAEKMEYVFYGASAFDQDISNWDVSSVKNMYGMFYGASAYNNGNQPLDWGDKTQLVEHMGVLFRDAVSFNQDINGWNVGNVQNMWGMFYGASSYNNKGKPLSWGDDTQSVEHMEFMFRGAQSFNQDISGWNVESVIDMRYMFEGATLFANDGVALNWNINSQVAAKNNTFSDSSFYDYQGHDVSSMYNMFDNSGLTNDLSKHPVGCTCDISGHMLP